MKRFAAVFLSLILLTGLLLPGCSSSGVSPANTGYAAGSDFADRLFRAEESFLLPAEIVRALALYAARDLDDPSLFSRVVYKYETAYMKTLVEKTAGSPAAFLEKMKACAASLGMARTALSSLTGASDTDAALYAAFGEDPPAFDGNSSTLSDLFLLCRALCENDRTRALYGACTVDLPELSSPLTRDAQLLLPASDRFLENAVLDLSAWTYDPSIKKPDQRCRLQLAAVRNGDALGFAAVMTYTGDDEARVYAAVDAENLAARAAGLDLSVSYQPSGTGRRAGMTVGASKFAAVILVLLAVILVLLVLVVTVSAVVRMKRNVEGRKKYAPPESPSDDRSDDPPPET